MIKRRGIEDYETVLEIPNLSNRTEIVEKYLNLLREKMFEAIENKNETELSRIDKKISKIKAPNK